MEQHHHPPSQPPPADDNTTTGPGTKPAGSGSFLCRQSSTRWTPTTEQIRILKDLYYNYGVRSPSADQIQRISARLRQYGKIEGKNVFYWFQNHKARERQKKRFVPDFNPNPNPSNPNSNHNTFFHHPSSMAAAASLRPSTGGNKYSSFGSATGGVPSSSSSAATSGVVAFGQVANYGYGSTATMEKNFRNCSISTGGGGDHGFGWIAVDPYPYSSRSMFDHKGFEDDQGDEEEDDNNYSAREIETLPLFPMHDNINGFCGSTIKHNSDGSGHGVWYDDVFMGGSRASLELSLNSYHVMSPGSP